jgi:phosphoadenosine phosphosulfate reductase
MVAEVDPSLPVIFLDTGMMFPETLGYAEHLRAWFGLTDFRIIRPDDGDGVDSDLGRPDLPHRDPDLCCHLRKVVPLDRALLGFSAWMTGIKRYHSEARRDAAVIRFVQGRYKISPLAAWGRARVERAFRERNLPCHPMVARGYPSIGCWPCTRPAAETEGVRAGRWSGMEKNECGIHGPAFETKM